MRNYWSVLLSVLVFSCFILPAAAAQYDAKLVTNTMPMVLNCNEKFQAIITMKNSGTAGWSEGGYASNLPKIRLGGNNVAGYFGTTRFGFPWQIHVISLLKWSGLYGVKPSATPRTTGQVRVITTKSIRFPLGFWMPTIIQPGEEYTFTLDLKAPATPGEYELVYQMVEDSDSGTSTWFGDKAVFDKVKVISAAGTAEQLAQKIFDKTNLVRTNNGLPPYTKNSALELMARDHSFAMAVSQILSHDEAGDGTSEDRSLKYCHCLSGENIAIEGSAYPGNLDTITNEIFNLWLNNDKNFNYGHRLNILDGETIDALAGDVSELKQGRPIGFTQMGVGAAYSDGWYVTQDFGKV